MTRVPTFLSALALVTIAAAPSEAQAPQSLSGVWALRLVTTAVSKVPVIGKVETESRFYGRTVMSESNGSLVLNVDPCRVDTDKTVGTRPVISKGLLAVMGPKRRTGSRNGSEVRFGRAVDVLGAKLKDEWNEKLPEDASDPRQWDEDRDGEPGVTVGIQGIMDGEVYVVQRSWNAFLGKLSDDGKSISGTVRWKTEQSLFGASSMWLKVNPKTEPHPDAAKNTFDMVRLESGETCSAVAKQGDALFGGKK